MLDDLLRRDPRMVERKKTGLAKARKRVCHRVPQHVIDNILIAPLLSPVHMGKAIVQQLANCLHKRLALA